jgi:hypothetical protein
LSDQGGWSTARPRSDGGDLNEDGTEIAGILRVASYWPGTFLMLRSRTTQTPTAKKAVARR